MRERPPKFGEAVREFKVNMVKIDPLICGEALTDTMSQSDRGANPMAVA
jgi:hypothetical protein